MISIVRTDASHLDFVNLVKQLDAYLKVTDGEDHAFYNQFNGIENIDHAILYYYNNTAIACGAFKNYNHDSVEIKRMYVHPDYRNKGAGRQILDALELWAEELGYKFCVLETGKRQFEAVSFYNRAGYKKIDNYGQYIGIKNSLCFQKRIATLD